MEATTTGLYRAEGNLHEVSAVTAPSWIYLGANDGNATPSLGPIIKMVAIHCM